MFEPPPGCDQPFVRDMSITLAEFDRSLREAFPGSLSGGPAGYRVEHEDALLEIALEAGPPRRIASLSLPTVRVCLCFRAGSAHERERLLTRMDRAMQRGGG